MRKIIVIIPAFNEEGTIFAILSTIQSLYPEFDLAVINDGSNDHTADEVTRSGAILLNHPYNMGYGVAIQTGYKFAFQHGYDYLIQLDGDGQHDPQSITTLYEALRNDHVDLVLGSRFIGEITYKPTFVRGMGMQLFKGLVNRVTHLNLSDVTTGFQGMNRNALQEFVKDSFPFDYPDADVIIMAHKKGLRIKEVPVKVYTNKTGKSMHASFHKAFLYVIQMLIAIFILLLQKEDRY